MSDDDWSRDLVTRTGFKFHVRPARPNDEPALAAFFTHVTADDLRFRFLSSIKEVGHDRLAAMTQMDHHKTEKFRAFAEGSQAMIASAMLACDDALDVGEVAIAIRSEDKQKGVSRELLSHIASYAKAKGV